MPLGLDDVRRALQVRDPALAQRIVRLADAADPRPESTPRAGAPTLRRFRSSLRSGAFKRLDSDGRREHRVQGMAAVAAADAEVPAPPRLGLHAVILELWHEPGAYARAQLLQVIAACPLKWGPWKALKQIYKEAEAGGDLEVFGALAARFDQAVARGRFGEVSGATLRYLARRAWRHLRRLGEGLPAVYADACVAVLAAYPEHTDWSGTWVANHIFYHETGEYRRGRFAFRRRPSTLLKYRAFPGLWRRTPRPLFSLLERARSEQARRFAVDALKADFRGALREVEPAWVARLVPLRSRIVDDFVVWLLGNVPRFEQGAFAELGLHAPVLTLLDSPSDGARAYAAEYVRAHARDLPLTRLIELVDNDHAAVRTVALDLIEARDPRKDVGLDAWGQILQTQHGFKLAGESLSKHFGAKELTRDWFAARLQADHPAVVRWVTGRMPSLHKPRQLGVGWFVELLDAEPPSRDAVAFGLEHLLSLGLDGVPGDALQRLLLRPVSRRPVQRWIAEERLPAAALGADFLKALMDPVRWQADPVVTALRSKDAEGAQAYREPDPALAALARELLADVRKFKAEDLGFEWLLELVARDDEALHAFAVDYLTRAFLPSDFAEPGEGSAAPAAQAEDADLGGASFLFTGKLATMTRSEAKKKVTGANGANASGVNGKLDYLVIGDEGSALYGEGRKGSKQVKAEKLIEGGAALRIISETAFLKMLAGEALGGDAASAEAGAERLWGMAFDPGPVDAPLARFARHYVRMHHPKICPAETDRYVDPGAEIPEDFLSFERVQPLLDDPRAGVRAVAVELARYEFGRWQPPLMALVALAESRHPEVRELVAKGFSADEHDPDWRDARIDPARLTPAAVYRFCESTRPEARDLGMALIAQHPRLAVPTELFRLTESPDAGVRGFVVRQLWSLYRAKGVTAGWQPPAPEGEPTPAPVGRPAEDPAGAEDVRDFLRLTLFGIPPGRPPAPREGGVRLRPLPARKAKLALIEVVRDLAVEDAAFAVHVRPLLATFLGSRGASERAACLVALTRIDRAYPALAREAA